MKKVSNDDRIIFDLLEKVDREFFVSKEETLVDFVLCNPPFFKNESDLAGVSDKIRKPSKRHEPNSVNPMLLNESIFDEHGEVGFVKRIIDDSLQLGKNIKSVGWKFI